MKVLLSRVQLFATPWTVVHQAPLSMGFSRQEYWSGLPFPSPEDLPNPGIETRSPGLQADSLLFEPPWKSKSPERVQQYILLHQTPKVLCHQTLKMTSGFQIVMNGWLFTNKNVCHWSQISRIFLLTSAQKRRRLAMGLTKDGLFIIKFHRLIADLLPHWRQYGAKVLNRGFQSESSAFRPSFALVTCLICVTFELFYCLNDAFLSVTWPITISNLHRCCRV